MRKYDLSWRELRNSGDNGWEKSTWLKQILNFVLAMIVFYFIIGFFSLLLIAHGADISYMSFWHEPWRQIFKLLEFLPKEVVPNGVLV